MCSTHNKIKDSYVDKFNYSYIVNLYDLYTCYFYIGQSGRGMF